MGVYLRALRFNLWRPPRWLEHPGSARLQVFPVVGLYLVLMIVWMDKRAGAIGVSKEKHAVHSLSL